MNKFRDLVFYLGVGLLFTHEVDAMPNREWVLLPLIGWLPDDLGQSVFVWGHIPLFSVLVWLISSENKTLRNRSRLFISGVLLLHGVIHAGLLGHEHYEFESVLSNVLIFGGAICGGVYIALSLKGQKTRT